MVYFAVIVSRVQMGLCSYSTLLSNATPCGQPSDYPGQLECVALKDCAKDVIGHLTSFKLSNDEGVGTEMKLLLARAGEYLFKNENPLCDVLNSDTCMPNYMKTNAFRGFLFGRKALCPEHLPTPYSRIWNPLEDKKNPLRSSYRIGRA